MKLIIFGASGDLARRKLFPALSRIDLEDVEIIGYARTKYDVEFSSMLQEVGNYSSEFLSRITYIRGSYDDLSKLRDIVDEETIFYLSVPPSVYIPLLKEISTLDHKIVALEKPYGEDIRSFMKMKELSLGKAVFIDHYLLKPLIVAMPELMRGCEVIRELMNNRCTKSVEIISKEVIGGEGRHYFDNNGIVKDIVQNHMAELIGVVASDSTESSRSMEASARMEVFESCCIDVENCVYGQYENYSRELHKDSNTETFCVVPMYINSSRWSKVPFIITAGKGMNEKRTEIVFEFKREAFPRCIDLIRTDQSCRVIHMNDISSIKLILNIYPRSEVFLEVVIGEEILEHTLYDKRTIDGLMNSHYGVYHDHEIVFDCLRRNHDFNNVSSKEAELLWRIFDPILSGDKELFYYSKGVDLPIEAENVIKAIKSR